MYFAYLDGPTRADVAFRATGRDLAEVFASSWRALLGIILPDPATLRPVVSRSLELREESGEMLLHAFLEAIPYYRDAEGLLLDIHRLHVGAEPWELTAELAGEAPDPARHRLGPEPKAVTWHRFSLARRRRRWEATVVVDV